MHENGTEMPVQKIRKSLLHLEQAGLRYTVAFLSTG